MPSDSSWTGWDNCSTCIFWGVASPLALGWTWFLMTWTSQCARQRRVQFQVPMVLLGWLTFGGGELIGLAQSVDASSESSNFGAATDPLRIFSRPGTFSRTRHIACCRCETQSTLTGVNYRDKFHTFVTEVRPRVLFFVIWIYYFVSSRTRDTIAICPFTRRHIWRTLDY